MTSRAASKLRRLRQRFGIGAPRVAIRRHIPWYWRVLSGIVLVAAVAFILWGYETFYLRTRLTTAHDQEESLREIQSLRNHVMELDRELTKLRGMTSTEDSRLQIEKTTLQQLSEQVRALGIENAALKQDLAFFEELMPSATLGDKTGFKINQLRVEPSKNNGEFQYRMLVVYNVGRHATPKAMQGRLRLIVKIRQNGKNATISIPTKSEENTERFLFELKSLHRLEGGFAIPQDATLRSVEAQLLQDGAVRAKQSVVF